MHTKPRLVRSGCCYYKWSSQRPWLSAKQRETKESAPTLTATIRSLLLHLLMLRSGRWNSVVNVAWSGGWSLWRDDIDAADYVVVVVDDGDDVYWRGLLDWGLKLTITQLALFTTLHKTFEELFDCTIGTTGCTEFTRTHYNTLSLLRHISLENKSLFILYW